MRTSRAAAPGSNQLDLTAPQDAEVSFYNAAGRSVLLGGPSGEFEETFEAGAWQPKEIESIDTYLGNLHRLTGNTRLLKNSWHNPTTGQTTAGSPVWYERLGRQTTFHTGRYHSAFVPGDITYTSATTSPGYDPDSTETIFSPTQVAYLRSSVYHEIGHKFDDPTETPFSQAFRNLSGWRPAAGTVLSGYVVSGDGHWHHLRDAAFVVKYPGDVYAARNPHEDYGMSFEAYMVRTFHGVVYPNEPAAKADNVRVLIDFFRGLPS